MRDVEHLFSTLLHLVFLLSELFRDAVGKLLLLEVNQALNEHILPYLLKFNFFTLNDSHFSTCLATDALCLFVFGFNHRVLLRNTRGNLRSHWLVEAAQAF